MTRSKPENLVELDPEIEARARRTHGETLRKKKQQRDQDKQASSESNSEPLSHTQSYGESNPNIYPTSSNANFEPRQMANQTIRELNAAPKI